MRHREARRLLPALLDRSLPAAREASLRAHAEACASCADALAELRAVDTLLRRLPASLVPMEDSPEAELRLASLARWTRGAEPLWSRRLGLSAVSAFAAAAAFALVLTVAGWSPVVEEPHTHRTYAAAFPDIGFTPRGWR